MSVVTVAAVGIAAVLLASQLKGMKGEYGFFLSAAAGLFIFFYGIQKLESILKVVKEIQESIHLNNVYFVTLMKMVGITYIGEFASGICKDNGCSFLGSQIEIFGKLSILAVSAPVVLALLNTLERFMA
ncbi:MAG: stage III sporulation AC/AD family protein [Lachnospiraceae bacterium]|nr:stage III sporulation AC/AD family protein [Lachnospiraceae bacterium]MDO5550783.1 stage III sporulation AC/AD family protein [Lachnospiraceae bacterium]